MELSIAKYIEIEGDFSKVYLLDKGYDKNTGLSSRNIPFDVLNAKWDELRGEFLLNIGGERMVESMKLQSEMVLYEAKYNIICELCGILAFSYESEIVSALSILGYKVNKKYGEEGYEKELKSIKTRAKSILGQSLSAKAKLEKILQENKEKAENEYSEGDGSVWLRILLSLGTANSIYYNPNEVGCFEFLELYKSALVRAEKQQQKQQNSQ